MRQVAPGCGRDKRGQYQCGPATVDRDNVRTGVSDARSGDWPTNCHEPDDTAGCGFREHASATATRENTYAVQRGCLLLVPAEWCRRRARTLAGVEETRLTAREHGSDTKCGRFTPSFWCGYRGVSTDWRELLSYYIFENCEGTAPDTGRINHHPRSQSHLPQKGGHRSNKHHILQRATSPRTQSP